MQILKLCARRAVATAVLLSALATIAGAVACSFLISDTPPAFTCVPGAADVCPSDKVCSPATSTCVPECTPGSCGAGQCVGGFCVSIMGEGGSDGTMGDDGATVDHDAQAAADTNLVGDAGPGANDGDVLCTGSGFGCKCTTTANCPIGLACVDKQAVTADIWNACVDAGGGGDGGSWSVCMEPCCTSSDCDLGDGGDSVCFATGAGGNYCIPPTWLGDRSTIGPNVGGAVCGGDAGACRSGLCLSGSNVCADTCCSSLRTNECAPNIACRFGPFPGGGFDTHEAAQCAAAPPGVGSGGNRCQSNSECRSNLCVGAVPDSGFMNSGNCQDACRSSFDCSGMMRQSNQTCAYVQPSLPRSTELVAACTPLGFGQQGGDGGAGDGSQCRVSGDCMRGSCIQGVCVTVCFVDSTGSSSDCTSNERCRPQPVQLGGAPYSVLACGL